MTDLLIVRYIERAEELLKFSIRYIEAVPLRLWRIRLFCVWPVALACATMNGIKRDLDDFINSNGTYKITRKEVKRILLKGYLAAFSNCYFKRILKDN